MMFLLWLSGRVLPFISAVSLDTVAIIDNLFILTLIVGIGYPLFRARQWQHAMIPTILFLMLVSNIVFYCGLLGLVESGITIGLYSGLYLVIGMILLMGRRVIPFFIEKGVDETVRLSNYKWLDLGSPVIFVGFWISDVFVANPVITAVFAATLFVLHTLRTMGWYTPGIWKKPLLWSIYLAYATLTTGFALHALVPVAGFSAFIALHAFAVGGVGVMTIGMMARVALGHTGRNVFDPPKIIIIIFILLLISAIVRILLPLLIPSEYTLWIGVSQVFWITSFTIFFLFYLPILCKPRIDGRFG